MLSVTRNSCFDVFLLQLVGSRQAERYFSSGQMTMRNSKPYGYLLGEIIILDIY